MCRGVAWGKGKRGDASGVVRPFFSAFLWEGAQGNVQRMRMGKGWVGTYLGGVAIQKDDPAHGLIPDRIRDVSSPNKIDKTKAKQKRKRDVGRRKGKKNKRTSPAAMYPFSAETATVVIWPLELTRSDVAVSTSVDVRPSQAYTWTLPSSYPTSVTSVPKVYSTP